MIPEIINVISLLSVVVLVVVVMKLLTNFLISELYPCVAVREERTCVVQVLVLLLGAQGWVLHACVRACVYTCLKTPHIP